MIYIYSFSISVQLKPSTSIHQEHRRTFQFRTDPNLGKTPQLCGFGFQVPSAPDLLRCAQDDRSRIFAQSGRRVVETREDALITPAVIKKMTWARESPGNQTWLENAPQNLQIFVGDFQGYATKL